MRRKLIPLNLALAALIAAAGWRIRDEWQSVQARRQTVVSHRVAPAPAPSASAPPAPPVVQPSNYIEVAQKALFWKDRNPQVILEAPAPVQEKPAPPLPVLYGVMDIGDGPILMMSEKGAARHRGVRVGETIGEYKLAALEGEALVLNWEGKTVRKKREELAPKKDDAPPVAADTGRPAPVVTSTPSAPSQPQSPAKSEPGVELTAGVKACIPGDTSPAGTVVDGYKKIVTPTPFGNQCRWEAVK